MSYTKNKDICKAIYKILKINLIEKLFYQEDSSACLSKINLKKESFLNEKMVVWWHLRSLLRLHIFSYINLQCTNIISSTFEEIFSTK